MLDVNIKIISELKSFLAICSSDTQIMNLCRTSQSAFIRDRKLSFERLVLFLSKLCKKTLSVELDHFFEVELEEPLKACSVSAFTQQRNKLDHLFFQLWNVVLCESFYHCGGDHIKTWRGYRIIAADGTAVSLISTKALSQYFGGQSNRQGAFTGAKAFLHYDVLNKLFVHAHFAPYRTSELAMAYPATDKLGAGTITIYDRNFCNYKMVALHRWAEEEPRFVIRGKESLKFIAAFIKSGLQSEEVFMTPGRNAIAGLRKSGFIITPKTKLKVRLVRVDLGNDKTEVLLTNLWESEGFGNELFKDLYFMRWDIETGISILKNLLALESFSGLSVQSVKQDFYATIFTGNLSALFIRQAEEVTEQKTTDQNKRLVGRPPSRYWPKQINRNKAIARLKQKLVAIFTSRNPSKIMEELTNYFRKFMLPVRKGRSFPRNRKHKQSFCKHRTFPNYKAAS